MFDSACQAFSVIGIKVVISLKMLSVWVVCFPLVVESGAFVEK